MLQGFLWEAILYVAHHAGMLAWRSSQPVPTAGWRHFCFLVLHLRMLLRSVHFNGPFRSYILPGNLDCSVSVGVGKEATFVLVFWCRQVCCSFNLLACCYCLPAGHLLERLTLQSL